VAELTTVSLDVVMERLLQISIQQGDLLKRLDTLTKQVEQIPLIQQRLDYEGDHQQERVDALSREVESLSRDVKGVGKSLDTLRETVMLRIAADDQRLKLTVAGITVLVGVGSSLITAFLERFFVP